jgi:hypothetical protein
MVICNQFLINFIIISLYSVETAYGVNSVDSGLMTFVDDAETGQFLFVIVLVLGGFACS